jgi:deoxyribonuclease V
MIAALDVHYDDTDATAAAVVFNYWTDAAPHSEYTVPCNQVHSYVPGEFFKRELPCLLAVLAKVPETLNLIVIDGYVSLGTQPGLGMHLWQALGEQVPIIGVAKTRYKSAGAVEITRGRSRSPLFVTAVGMDPNQAAESIRSMAGEARIPKMLKRADELARSGSSRVTKTRSEKN